MQKVVYLKLSGIESKKIKNMIYHYNGNLEKALENANRRQIQICEALKKHKKEMGSNEVVRAVEGLMGRVQCQRELKNLVGLGLILKTDSEKKRSITPTAYRLREEVTYYSSDNLRLCLTLEELKQGEGRKMLEPQGSCALENLPLPIQEVLKKYGSCATGSDGELLKQTDEEFHQVGGLILREDDFVRYSREELMELLGDCRITF